MKKLVFILLIFISISSSAQWSKPVYTGIPINETLGSHYWRGGMSGTSPRDTVGLFFYSDSATLWNNKPYLYFKSKPYFHNGLYSKSKVTMSNEHMFYWMDNNVFNVGAKFNILGAVWGTLTDDNFVFYNQGYNNEEDNKSTGNLDMTVKWDSNGVRYRSTQIRVNLEQIKLEHQTPTATFYRGQIFEIQDTGIYYRMTGNRALFSADSAATHFKIYTDLIVAGEVSSSEITHAFFSTEDTTYTPAVTQNVYTKLGFPGTKHVENFTKAGDSLIVTKAGSYFMSLEYTVQGAMNEDYRMALYVNGSKVKSSTITTTGSSNYVCAIVTWHQTLSINDRISIRITNLTNSNDPTLKSGSFYIIKEK